MNFKIFNIIIITTTFAFASTTHAQQNFVPGEVVTNKGDTLKGLIDYRDWEKNPKEISFKAVETNEVVKYLPTHITSFKVEDVVYRGGIVNVERSPFQIGELSNSPALKLETDAVFLQQLVEGTKGLLYYKDSNGKENFYIKNGNAFELLPFKKFLTEVNGKILMSSTQGYIGQLSLYLSDCNNLSKKLAQVEYTKRSLSNLFQYYYQCKGEAHTIEKKRSKIAGEFGILAGLSSTTLKFKSEDFGFLTHANYSTSNNFAGGISLNLLLPRNRDKWSINNELLYTSFKVEGKATYYGGYNTNSISYSTFERSYLKLNNMLRFRFPTKTIKPFFNIGISNGLALREESIKREETPQGDLTEMVKALESTRKYEQGFLIGGGVNFKKFNIELRFERGNGFSNFSSLKSMTSRYLILLNYRL